MAGLSRQLAVRAVQTIGGVNNGIPGWLVDAFSGEFSGSSRRLGVPPKNTIDLCGLMINFRDDVQLIFQMFLFEKLGVKSKKNMETVIL